MNPTVINGASHGMPLPTLDALGQHHPINPDAPNPRNAATVAHLTQIMAAMRTLHKSMQMAVSPLDTLEQITDRTYQEVA